MPTKQIRKDIGYATQTVRQKFAVGDNTAEAKRREQRIKDLYQSAEAQWIDNHRDEAKVRRFTWSDNGLAFDYAKRLAQGETVFQLQHPGTAEFGNGYIHKMNLMMRMFPTLNFTPSDPALFAESERFADTALEHELAELKRRGIVPQQQTNLIQANGTLHQQLDRRMAVIEQDYFDPTLGHISDWGKGKQKTLRRIEAHIHDIELNQLNIAALDSIIGTFRNRPISKRTGKPLDAETCSDTITEFKEFLRWLDTLSGTGWELPAKFAYISTRVRPIEEEAEEKEPEIFTPEQLVILNRYATPIERIFFLLGINCSFGADQSGRLRIREIHLDADPPHIKRTRKKSGVTGRHLLWAPTQEAIRWALWKHADRRPEQFLLLNKSGLPYWRKTSGGNRASDIPKLWRYLIRRVRKDQPDFPAYPFNALRNTGADMVRQIGGQELAQLQLTHKHQSPDKNMRRYTRKRVAKLFRVLAHIEKKLAPVFAAAEQPWVKPAKVYKPKSIDNRIIELHREGLTPNKITAALAKEGKTLSHMTVRRHLKRLLVAER